MELTSGLPMALIGMGTVFSALVALVVVTSTVTRVLERVHKAPAHAAAPQTPVGGALHRTETSEASDEGLIAVALAAYAFHRRRQANVRASTPSSEWLIAGRMQQIATFRR